MSLCIHSMYFMKIKKHFARETDLNIPAQLKGIQALLVFCSGSLHVNKVNLWMFDEKVVKSVFWLANMNFIHSTLLWLQGLKSVKISMYRTCWTLSNVHVHVHVMCYKYSWPFLTGNVEGIQNDSQSQSTMPLCAQLVQMSKTVSWLILTMIATVGGFLIQFDLKNIWLLRVMSHLR